MTERNYHREWLESKGWQRFETHQGGILFQDPNSKEGKLYRLMPAVAKQIEHEVKTQ